MKSTLKPVPTSVVPPFSLLWLGMYCLTRTLRYGRLDYAHNNAGIEGEKALTHDYSTAMFDRVMSVNLRGVWLCLKAQIPLMLATGKEGAIVISSSTAGMWCLG